MRKIRITLILSLLLLGGCAATKGSYERDRALAYYCQPGSAIKRAVPQGVEYPGWMLWDGRGNCRTN